MTLRDALAHSLNVATVKVAEMVGYDAVVDMANRAGMNYKIQPTPAVALGAYEITPLEAAGAYTIFANQGEYVKPNFIRLVRSSDGKMLYKDKPETKPALDPRVAYLMTNLMEEVLRSGTAAGVRVRYNLDFPAAGKTGTSHDGWFAGYTSELLCVVWVGFDDNRELDLEGAHSAAPIWAQFMKGAMQFPRVSRRQGLPGARRHRYHRYRSRIGYAGHSGLPHPPNRSLHRRHAAGGLLPAARRPQCDQRRRMATGAAAGCAFHRRGGACRSRGSRPGGARRRGPPRRSPGSAGTAARARRAATRCQEAGKEGPLSAAAERIQVAHAPPFRRLPVVLK